MQLQEGGALHIAELARLFDLYRQFYTCEPDLGLAREYMAARLAKKESTIFVASTGGEKLSGFVQLYPTFCSVQAVKIFVLYDLFVDADARNAGIGALLMNKARGFAIASGASRLDLRTAFSNKPGQHLYEKCGYERVLEDFHSYSLPL